jgi:hypothetical protein
VIWPIGADRRRLAPESPLVQEVKALTHDQQDQQDQDGLVQGQTRLVNQLTACLKASYPVALTLFATLQQPTTLAFLRASPTREAARGASVEEVTAFLQAPQGAAALSRTGEGGRAPLPSSSTRRSCTRILLRRAQQPDACWRS